MEQWAEIRRMHFVEGLSIKGIARRTGRDRKTIRRAIRSPEPPGYSRPPAGSKLDPHREQIAVLVRDVEGITNTRIRELITEAGYQGGSRSSMTTCASCARFFARSAPISARSIAPASSPSST